MIQDYLDFMKAVGHSKKSIEDNYYSLNLFANFMRTQGITDVKFLNFNHMHQWQLYQNQRVTSKGLPLRPRSINNDFSKLKSFLLFLFKRDVIHKKLHEKIEFVKEPKLLPTSLLTDDEVSKLLDVFDVTTPIGFRNKTIVSFLYSSGLRLSELCKLDIKDVSLTQKTALVFGKGRKERIVPVGESTIVQIESYIKAIRPFHCVDATEEALFLSYRGSRISTDAIQDMMRKATKEAGFKGITAHSMRRSFATEMIKASANLYHVKDIMGHEDLRHLQKYVKLDIADLQRTHKKFHPRG